MVYSNSSISKHRVGQLILLAGTPEARLRWLRQSLHTQLDAQSNTKSEVQTQASFVPPVALLASGEGFASSNSGPEGLPAQIHDFDNKAKASGWVVTRLSMGCVCCSSKLIMSTHLGRLLRLVKPATLLLELDTQSHVDQVRAMLSEGQWQGWFDSIEVFQAI